MNNLLKLATALPAFALLGACATTAPPTIPTTSTPAESITKVAYDRMAPAPYACTDGSEVLAKQSINKKQVMLTATLPKVNGSQQSIILNGGIQGDTANYVNDSNPEVIYAWHMKGNEGILAMKWANGKTYQVNCVI
jgi:membrane-bound inhibitor of C-type lysozyme